MPEVTINIGGRAFEVACQPGEEDFLKTAAQMLDDEATALANQIGRMPENRMLLMSGLLLADKTADFQDKLRAAENKLETAQAELQSMRAELDQMRNRPVTTEVQEVIPQNVTDLLETLTARLETLAVEKTE